MTRWAPHLYRQQGDTDGVPSEVVEAALCQQQVLQSEGMPTVLTLGHLAFRTGTDYAFLRSVVTRGTDPYRVFSVRKRSGGRRYISVPCPSLLKAQRWLDHHVLAALRPSPNSYAYSTGSSTAACAKQHVGCRWLLKIDLRHFFESLSEIQAYRVFLAAGFGELLSFELARLCTKVLPEEARKYKRANWGNHHARRKSSSSFPEALRKRMLRESAETAPPLGWAESASEGAGGGGARQRHAAPYSIRAYDCSRIGHLPQGAPTSPRLSNLIVRELDSQLAELAGEVGMVYTRYADDMAFSTRDRDFGRDEARGLIRRVYAALPSHGLRPHPQKVQVIPPGARKVVLGLLVDGDRPRLTKEFRRRLECHIHFCRRDAAHHAKVRGFRSTIGLRNHVHGLITYARQVDPLYAQLLQNDYESIEWPI